MVAVEWASLGIGGGLFIAGAVVLVLTLRTTGQIVNGFKAILAEVTRERDEARRERDRFREDLERIEEEEQDQ